MASLESELAHRFGVRDLEIVSGRPRWQADVDVARRRLLERGLVTGGGREGIWVLTRAGEESVRAFVSSLADSNLRRLHARQDRSVIGAAS
jgi:hypothetical protein